MTEPRRLAPVARTRERSGPMASARTRVTRGTSSVRSPDRAWTYQLSSIRSPEADTKASLDPDPDRRYDPRRPEGVATELVLAPPGAGIPGAAKRRGRDGCARRRRKQHGAREDSRPVGWLKGGMPHQDDAASSLALSSRRPSSRRPG